MVLENRLRVRTAELTSLQKKVNRLLAEPPDHTSSHRVTTPTHLISDISFLKENIIPK